MSEDKDLERLQAKRLEEMRKNLSSQQEKEKIAASQKEQKDNLFLVCRELYKLFSTTSPGNKN